MIILSTGRQGLIDVSDFLKVTFTPFFKTKTDNNGRSSPGRPLLCVYCGTKKPDALKGVRLMFRGCRRKCSR